MKHLIVGTGNIGLKHKKTLHQLGDEVVGVDLEFKPDKFNYNGINSVLICTPPDTHAEYISWFAKNNPLPLFCEKPIFTKPSTLTYPGISMIACNWRWCPHISNDPFQTFNCQYPTDQNNALLDLIHFFDLFWEKIGPPNKKKSRIMPIEKSVVSHIVAEKHNYFASITINPTTKTTINGQIHSLCPMFKKQMSTWRKVIAAKQVSPNPVELASKRMNWMLRLQG